MGHSFGGVNVRLYASLYPSEVAGLILVDSTPEDYRERFLPIMPSDFQEAYNKQFIYEGTYDQFMKSLEEVRLHRKTFIDTNVIILSAGKAFIPLMHKTYGCICKRNYWIYQLIVP